MFQYGFFSSTFKNSIIEFIKKKRPDIFTIRLRRNQQRVQTVEHWYTRIENFEESKNAIYELATNHSNCQTYVFARSKDLVKQISEYLIGKGISCRAFSSDLSSKERDETLDKFRNEETRVLITSDVLSRGIHLPYTYFVINYQTPIQLVPPPKNRYVIAKAKIKISIREFFQIVTLIFT